jgi:hypothetical protein
MVVLDGNELIFGFPELHPEAACRVQFQRTLRIPDDNREYPLPAGLGRFPLDHVEDYYDRLSAKWRERGGVFLPMYQAEAMWLAFSAEYPFAVKIAAGKINAVSGEEWKPGFTRDPQNYLVIPDQPWLDGFCVNKGQIRQFVAMPLGDGYTVEEQLTGAAEHGGLQIAVCPMKPEHYERYKSQRATVAEDAWGGFDFDCSMSLAGAPAPSMGLAPGGLMRQAIYEDRHGMDAWEASMHARCFVHLLNALQYRSVTGKAPPTAPPTAKDYAKAGIPWFEYYTADLKALAGAAKLAGLDSVAAKGIKTGKKPLPENDPVTPENVVTLGAAAPGAVRDGEW